MAWQTVQVMPAWPVGCVHVVEVRVVERAAEERHRVVAAGAPARRLHVAVALQRRPCASPDAEQVGRVVERAELVGRVEPALVDVLVALQAVVVHHQRVGGDELAVGGAGAGRARSTCRPPSAPRGTSARVLGVQEPPCPTTNTADPGPPGAGQPPLDRRARPAGARRTGRRPRPAMTTCSQYAAAGRRTRSATAAALRAGSARTRSGRPARPARNTSDAEADGHAVRPLAGRQPVYEGRTRGTGTVPSTPTAEWARNTQRLNGVV